MTLQRARVGRAAGPHKVSCASKHAQKQAERLTDYDHGICMKQPHDFIL